MDSLQTRPTVVRKNELVECKGLVPLACCGFLADFVTTMSGERDAEMNWEATDGVEPSSDSSYYLSSRMQTHVFLQMKCIHKRHAKTSS